MLAPSLVFLTRPSAPLLLACASGLFALSLRYNPSVHSFSFSNMASNQPSNNSVYKSSGGFKNFTESYGGKLYNDSDVQEAKAIGAAMKHYDAQQGSSGAAKSSSKSTSNRK
ncbi:hypothetical protein KC19_4G256400 [Ceratodon purpureus]|uniref:Uncharacterized protein n=1 Tax=Ceratodon purpureus TaxID=3225 RepID=A0A8T0ICM0_CERPU|nr:hypothetical protein KC19_4G256400 [Ceratodon purpureus]